jgi:hypothetical protein
MREIIRRAVKLGLIVTVGIGIAAAFSSGLRTIFLDVYLLAMGGVLLLALVRTTRAKAPAAGSSDFDRTLANMRTHPPDSGPVALARDLDLAMLSSFHLHVRVRPVFREVAAHRLHARYGIDLATEPERARELAGAELWELVRPGRRPPDDRLARGPSLAYLRELVTRLERI